MRVAVVLCALFGLGIVVKITAQPARAACSTSGVTGSATTTVTVPTDFAGSYKTWLEFRGPTNASVAIEIDGGACVTQQLSNLQAGAHTWFAVGSAQSWSAGSHTLKVISYTGGVYVRNGILINDTCVPTGDGSNCDTETSPTVTVTSSSPPPTTTVTTTVTPPPTTTVTTTVTPPPSTDPLPAGTYNDNDPRIQYSAGWNVDTEDHFTTAEGLTATYKFNGTQTKILSTKVSDGGVLYVKVDGGPEKLADLRGSYQQGAEVFVSDVLAYGTHTVSLRTAKHPTYGTTNVNIDSVAVLSQVASPPPPTAVNPPTNLKAAAVSSGQINLTWTASTSANVVGYIVYRNGVEYARVGNVTSYTDVFLPAGTTFSYKIKTLTTSGATSDFSATVSATTQCGWFKC